MKPTVVRNFREGIYTTITIRAPADPENPKGRQGKIQICLIRYGVKQCTLYYVLKFSPTGKIDQTKFLPVFVADLNQAFPVSRYTRKLLAQQIITEIEQMYEQRPEEFKLTS